MSRDGRTYRSSRRNRAREVKAIVGWRAQPLYGMSGKKPAHPGRQQSGSMPQLVHKTYAEMAKAVDEERKAAKGAIQRASAP